MRTSIPSIRHLGAFAPRLRWPVRAIMAAACALIAFTNATADILVLKGTLHRVEGTITETPDGCVVVRPGAEPYHCPKSRIHSIIRNTPSSTPSLAPSRRGSPGTPWAPSATNHGVPPDLPPPAHSADIRPADGATTPDDSPQEIGPSMREIVILKDGRRLSGEVNRTNRDDAYMVFTSDSSVTIVPKSDVQAIVPADAQAGRPLASAPPTARVPDPFPRPFPPASPPPPPPHAQEASGIPPPAPTTPSPTEGSSIPFQLKETIVIGKDQPAIHGGKVIAISPDLARGVVRSTRGAPSLCDLQARREVPFTAGRWALCFSPDSKYLVGGGSTAEDDYGYSATVRAWDAGTGRELAVVDRFEEASKSGPRHGPPVHSVAFDRTGRFFAINGGINATGFTDFGHSFIKVYAVDGGVFRKVGEVKHSGRGGTDSPLAFSPDGRSVYAGWFFPDQKKQVCRIGLSAANPPPEPVLTVGADPIVLSNGGPLAIKRPSGTTEVVDLEKKVVLGSLGYSYENGPMAISADDRFMCVGTEEFAGLPHHISVWDLAERKRISVLPIPDEFGRGDVVQISGDGKRIAFGFDARFCVWEKSAPPAK